MKEKLYRSNNDRVIAGVCGGLGEYFGIDPILIRLGFVLVTVWGGGGLVVYIIMALLIPEKKGKGVALKIENVGEKVKDLVAEVRESPKNDGGGKMVIGILLILWGGAELLKKLNWWQIDIGELVWRWWPAGVILAGISVIFGRKWWAGMVGFGLVGLLGYMLWKNSLGFW